MSSQVPNVGAGQNAASTSNAGTGGAAGSQNTATMSTTISSMEDLRSQSPEVYKAMMEGIAMGICNEMQRHEATRKKIAEQYRRTA